MFAWFSGMTVENWVHASAIGTFLLAIFGWIFKLKKKKKDQCDTSGKKVERRAVPTLKDLSRGYDDLFKAHKKINEDFRLQIAGLQEEVQGLWVKNAELRDRVAQMQHINAECKQDISNLEFELDRCRRENFKLSGKPQQLEFGVKKDAK